MQLGLLFLLVFVILLWGIFSGKAVFRILAGLLAGGIALAGFAGAVGLIQVGQRAHWTSDGPGMLLIMLGIPVCGVIGLVFGSLTLKAFFRESRPASALEGELQSGQDSNPALMDATTRNRVMAWIVGGLVLFIAASSAFEHRAGKPSHDAGIRALHHYQPGGLASLDGAGVLKLWQVSGRRHRATVQLTISDVPTVLIVTPDERTAFVLNSRQQLSVYDLTKSAAAIHTVSPVRDLCFEGGDSVLAIRDRKLVRIGAAATNVAAPLQGVGSARALTCRQDKGEIVYVDETNVLHLFDERTGMDRFALPLSSIFPVRLVPSPEFRRVLVLDSKGFSSMIDLATREVTPLPRHHRSHHIGFLSEDQIVVGEVSSVRVDLPGMKSTPYFNLGQPVTALTTLPQLSTTSMAFGTQLYIAYGAQGVTAKTERLMDPRF